MKDDVTTQMQDLGVDVVPTGEIHVGGAEDGAGPAGGDAGATSDRKSVV